MNNFDKKNHEEQSGKIPARLFKLYCVDNRHSSIGSVYVKLKNYNNEKEHGNSRPNNQNVNRCYHYNTLFHERNNRNIRDCAFSSWRGICADKLNQLLSNIRTLRSENLPTEKRIKSQQLIE